MKVPGVKPGLLRVLEAKDHEETAHERAPAGPAPGTE
jgi:hypothetical protein